MKINKFHSLCINHAHRMYAGCTQVPAFVFALKANGEVICLTRQFEDYDDKIHQYNMYAGILQFEKVRMYSFISEMWYVQSKTPIGIMPSEHADRQTGVMIVSSDKNKTLHNLFLIHKGHLVHEPGEDCSEYKNYIDLFGRIPPISASELKKLAKLGKPTWYTTITHKEFSCVPIDA